MIELITTADIMVVVALMTVIPILATIVVDLITFLPRLLLNMLNRMRNNTIFDTDENFNQKNILESTLEAKLEAKIDTTKLIENWAKRVPKNG